MFEGVQGWEINTSLKCIKPKTVDTIDIYVKIWGVK